MDRVTPFRSAMYHFQESELLEALAAIGKKIGIKNKTEREKLANGIKYYKHRATDREVGDSLYIRTDLKKGIQKAVFMEADWITEEKIRATNMLTPSSAILSIRYGSNEGSYVVETFIPI